MNTNRPALNKTTKPFVESSIVTLDNKKNIEVIEMLVDTTILVRNNHIEKTLTKPNRQTDGGKVNRYVSTTIEINKSGLTIWWKGLIYFSQMDNCLAYG